MARSKIPSDPRGGHVRLYWEITDSVAWRALSWADRGLWLAMRRKLLSTNNGNIEATIGTLKHAGITSSATLSKGLRALMVAGFIDKTRQGGIAYGSKVCNLFRFTDEQVFDQPKLGIRAVPASKDWQQYTKIAEVRAVLKAAHEAAKRPKGETQPKDQNATSLQKLKRTRSKSEWKSGVSDSVPEQEAASFIHKLKQGQSHETAR